MTRGAGRAAAAVTVLAVLLTAGCTGGSGDPAAPPDAGPLPTETVVPVSLQPCPDAALPEPSSDGLPDLVLPCLGPGPSVALARLGGTPTVVNLWATWCGPCAKEMPYFAASHERLGERVRFLGVLTEDPSPRWGELLRTTGVRYPSVRDDDADLRTRIGVVGMPVTLFVRSDGSLAHREVGQVTSQAELEALIREHLEVAA